MTAVAILLFPWIIAATALGAQDPRRPWTVAGGGPGVEATVRQVEAALPGIVRELQQHFPGTPARPFRVVVHSDPSSLPPGVLEHLHPGTPGLALLARDEIHLIRSELRVAPPDDVDTVLRHEVVHVLLHHFAGSTAEFVPRWFHEGLAQVLSGDTYLDAKEVSLVTLAAHGRLLRFTDLRENFPGGLDRRVAYAQSFSFVGYLVRELGLPTLVEATRFCNERFWYSAGFARVTGDALHHWEARWRRYVLHESGATWRFLFENCFGYVMIGGFVLLALAGIRRWNRDLEFRRKLERAEALELADDDFDAAAGDDHDDADDPDAEDRLP